MSIEGYAALQRRIAAIKGPVLGRAVMQTLGMATVRESKLLVPRKTGNLGRTIHLAEADDRHALVAASARYAGYVEHGTRAHDITPNARKALRWAPGAAGGPTRRLSGAARKGNEAWMFAKRVHHPGTKAEPFLRPGAERAIEGAGLAERIVSAWNDAA